MNDLILLIRRIIYRKYKFHQNLSAKKGIELDHLTPSDENGTFVTSQLIHKGTIQK